MQIRHDSNRRSPIRMTLPVCPRCHDALASVILRTEPTLYLAVPVMQSTLEPAKDERRRRITTETARVNDRTVASVLMSTDYGRCPIKYEDSTCIVCGLPIVVRHGARRTTHLCPTHTRDAMHAKAIASNAKSKVKREATLKAPG